MESHTDRTKKWTLKQINKCWFLDVGGKLRRMSNLNYSTDVHMEDNIIFADDLVFQLTEESDGEILLEEIKDICQRDKISEYENKESKECCERSNDDKRESKVTFKTQYVHDEDTTQHTTVSYQNTNRSSSKRLTLVEDPEYLYGDDVDTESEQGRNYELDSAEYVPKTGKIKGFFKRIKQIVKKKPTAKQKEERLYEDVSKICKEITPANSGNGYDEEVYYEYILFQHRKEESACSDAVQGAKIVTALFDFNRFSDEEISFQKQDKLKLHRETVRDREKYESTNCCPWMCGTCYRPAHAENPFFPGGYILQSEEFLRVLADPDSDDFADDSDWCLAEHMATGEKGYIPLPYVTEDIHALTAQSWWFEISRHGAVQLLKSPCCALGTYLVRPSESERGENVLSLLYTDRMVAHYRIRSQNGRLSITLRRMFSDIFELIAFYKCTADGLQCKLESPAPKQNPLVYPRNIEVERRFVDITTSSRCGDYGGFVNGKFCDTLDVTIVTKFKMTVDNFLAEAKVLHNFRQCKHFVRVLAVVTKPEPLMMILNETVHSTLQQHLRIDGGKTITFKSLTEIAAEIAEGMAFLEKENIVHRNLKAENVFVCELYQPKIVHPKLSKMLKYRSSDEHLEDENDWQWTAPEDIDDETLFKQLSTKSDVWSFGVLLYELITFGKEPYAGLTEKDTLRRLHEGFRMSKPKDGPLPCPIAFYATILKCWHRLPECRPTFHFLADFLHDFECATESEIGLNDANKLDLYMRGYLHQEPAKVDSNENVNVKSLTKPGARLNPQTSGPQESVPTASENIQNVGTTEQHAQRNSNGKLQISGGFSVRALYDYEADMNDEISMYVGDIITDVDLEEEDCWIGTAPNGSRGRFPSIYVEVFENDTCDVTTSLTKPGTTERHAQRSSNRKLQISGGFSVRALYDYEADMDDEISMYVGDIITDVDPEEEDCWIGTAPNGSRGQFPSIYVEVFENAYSDVTK